MKIELWDKKTGLPVFELYMDEQEWSSLTHNCPDKIDRILDMAQKEIDRIHKIEDEDKK